MGDMNTATEYLKAFDQALGGNPRAPFVTRYDETEIIGRGLTPIVFGRTGCLVIRHDDGRVECAGLFSDGPKGSGFALLDYVIEHYGVNYVECFEPLNGLYASLGFELVRRSPWNPDYAPGDWSADLGTPDYCEMVA